MYSTNCTRNRFKQTKHQPRHLEKVQKERKKNRKVPIKEIEWKNLTCRNLQSWQELLVVCQLAGVFNWESVSVPRDVDWPGGACGVASQSEAVTLPHCHRQGVQSEVRRSYKPGSLSCQRRFSSTKKQLVLNWPSTLMKWGSSIHTCDWELFTRQLYLPESSRVRFIILESNETRWNFRTNHNQNFDQRTGFSCSLAKKPANFRCFPTFVNSELVEFREVAICISRFSNKFRFFQFWSWKSRIICWYAVESRVYPGQRILLIF